MRQLGLLEAIAEAPVAAEPRCEPELQFYQPALLPPRSLARSFLMSAVLHCACIFGLPPLMDLLPESDAEAWARHMRSMRPLEIRVPERLYFSSTAPERPDRPAPPKKPKLTPEPKVVAKADHVPLAAPQPEAARTAPKQFKLPANVRRVDSDQTLIQSHLPPEMPVSAQMKLPQLILLSGPVLPRPAPRRFVEPGKSAASAVVPRVDAPPQLAPPSDANADLRISSMLAGPATALLRLPKPNVPARKFQVPAPLPTGRGASVSPTLGEPINILALSTDPAALQERVTIPLGNQIGRLPSLPAYSEAGPAGPPSKSAGNGSGAASGASGSNGSGGGLSREGELAEFAKALATLPQRFSTPIRIEHPVNAVFDVVVMQSSADPAFAESARALSGQPVYTVYLQVGAPRAWILQFCVAKEVAAAPAVVGGVVNIGNPSPVKAPFPLVTVLPPVTMLPRSGYIIVHASLDTSGQLKNLVVMRAPNGKMNDLILTELGKWQFRPAVRDGAPVAVEVLLAIPPQDV